MSAPVIPKRPNFVLLILTASIVFALATLMIFRRSSDQPSIGSQEGAPASHKSLVKSGGGTSGFTEDKDGAGFSNWSEEKWRRRLTAAQISDYPALMKYAMQIKDDLMRARVIGALTGNWINQDLRNFIASVDATDVDDKDGDAIWKALTPAWEYALPLLNDRAASMSELSDILHRVVTYLAAIDPNEAVAWSRRWLQGDMLASALAGSAVEMARTSPQKAFEVLDAIDAPARRVDAISGIGAILGEGDADKAIAWVDSLADPAERPYAMGGILTTMAVAQPARAAREFEQFRAKITSEYTARMQGTHAETGRNPATETEAGTEAGDPEPTTPGTNPQLHLLSEAGVAIAKSWAAVDPAGAMQWIDTLPTGRMKQETVQSALGSWAESRPQEAFAAYEREYAAVDPQPAEDIFRAWAERHPTEAAAQAAAVQNEGQRAFAIAGTVSGWLNDESNSGAAEAWADQLPAGKSRDVANAGIADAVSDSSPALAWKRALLIQDPDLRKEATNNAFASFVSNNPGMARTALQTAHLPDAEAADLRSVLDTVAVSGASN